MKANCRRISDLLKSQGFATRKFGGPSGSCGFVRNDSTPSLFQMIDVSFSGEDEEAAAAYVTLSATKWVRVKGLSISRHLDEIAWDEARGWSVIKTAEEARTWEASLALLGPIKADELASKSRTSLLERTQKARSNAQAILSKLAPTDEILSHIGTLETTQPREKIEDAQRLSHWPGVLQASGLEHAYYQACLIILNSTNATSSSQDPLKNEQLMWEIQLITDKIVSLHRSRRN